LAGFCALLVVVVVWLVLVEVWAIAGAAQSNSAAAGATSALRSLIGVSSEGPRPWQRNDACGRWFRLGAAKAPYVNHDTGAALLRAGPARSNSPSGAPDAFRDHP
jgi:hypothetical protein